MTSAAEPALWRLEHIRGAISDIRNLLANRKIDDLGADKNARAAFERYLEVISEASRYIPDAWKLEHPHVPWRQVQDLGNVIRHIYHRVEVERLWTIYEDDLDPLEAAIEAMIVRYGPTPSPHP